MEQAREGSGVRVPPPTALPTREGPPRPRVWGRSHPAPGPAPSWSAEALARDRPDRGSRGYSPALPGARPPVTSATPAAARRSSSALRGEARTLAMSGPGGSEAAGCSDPAWPPQPLAPNPAPQPLGPLLIGCGAPKPRPGRSEFPKPPGGRQRALDPGSLLWASCVSPSASGSRAAVSKREVRGWRPLWGASAVCRGNRGPRD